MPVRTTAQRGAGLVASVLRTIGLAIVAVIVAYIVLTLLDANPANWWATLIRDAAQYLDLGLSTLFLPAEPKLAVALNFGAAALLWFVITTVAVRLVRRIR